MERRMTGGKIEVRRKDDGGVRIGGHAAVFYDGTPDTEYWIFDDLVERVMPGAFDTVLARGDDVAALWDHNVGQLLGRTASGTLRLEQDDVGLAFEVDLPDTQLGRDIGALVERGDVTGASIGFAIGDDGEEVWRRLGSIDVREIYKVGMLRDASPVTFPAYAGTDVAKRAVGDCAETQESRDAWRRSLQARIGAVMARAVAVEADKVRFGD